jgi:hypothetical protein
MRARIKAELVVARDLKPGELFSIVGPDYWDGALDHGSVGERIYVRTNMPSSDFPDEHEAVYRITIKTD